jgi:hypothetical protein
MKPTYAEQATNLNLWREYVDPARTVSDRQFEELSFLSKLAIIHATYGTEAYTPQVEELMEKHHLFDSFAWWDTEGGRISIDKATLRQALEEAYDPSMPDWVFTVQLPD